MKDCKKPEAVDAYVAVLPRGYYAFSGLTPDGPRTELSRAVKIRRWFFRFFTR
jgi:hypothetical protein